MQKAMGMNDLNNDQVFALYQKYQSIYLYLWLSFRKNYIQKYFEVAIDTDKHNYYKKRNCKIF